MGEGGMYGEYVTVRGGSVSNDGWSLVSKKHMGNKKMEFTRDVTLRLGGSTASVYDVENLMGVETMVEQTNMEAEKQIKFFQGCVAAAFSERDQAIIEAEKVKEGQEVMQQKIFDLENRLEELQLAYQEEKKVHDIDQKELFRFKEQNEAFERVINKFYEIRQSARGHSEDSNLEDKYACLLQDPTERWNFSDNRETATSKYIASLEEELKSLRYMVENLQNNLRVGVEIERHLKGKVCLLEEKQITSDYMMNKGLSGLRNFHTQKKNEIMNLLVEEGSRIGSMLVEVQEKMREFHLNKDLEGHVESTCDDTECRDVHISSDINASIGTEVVVH
ncbi:hypothetical protein QJS04_geneDACA001724 [Acorus gramineus]|uniref:Uncharacterized protein n=1 Tax=Acorus gramineus TaxID=55184 RepID=A0AAV9BEQ8_ACOGR|nr:hypothetical protein QJS04_geneDACA001724 [Acorus gramineus]